MWEKKHNNMKKRVFLYNKKKQLLICKIYRYNNLFKLKKNEINNFSNRNNNLIEWDNFLKNGNHI